MTEEEKAILAEIEFGPGGYYASINDAPVRLLRSLYKRGAVPEIRRKYLTDQRYFIAHVKGSRLENFRGRSIAEKVNHPHFGPYLWYLLYGPRLPESTIKGFYEIVERDMGTTGEIMKQLCRFARAETRRLRLEAHEAREEFFKLALECTDGDLTVAEAVRNAAGQAANAARRR